MHASRIANGLRRKAAKLHSKANDHLAAGRVWEATQCRTQARALESKAARAEAVELAAGFDDDDLPRYCTARPRGELSW